MKLTAIEIKAAKPKEKAYKLSNGGGMYLEVFPNGDVWQVHTPRAGSMALISCLRR